MTRKKLHIYFLTSLLSLLLATSGLTQGVDICKGKCCEKTREAKQVDSSQTKPVHEMAIEFGLPLCNLHNSCANSIEIPAPEKNSNDALPVCCHLKKAGQKAQGVTTTNSWVTDRSTVVGIHAILSDFNFANTRSDPAIENCAIHPRAAPVPLYLKNASFIC